jgi:ribonuclease HII
MDLDYLKKFPSIIGCDEVGRGPIAGPVNSCAVKISDSKTIEYLLSLNVTDSKKLSTKKRLIILDTLGVSLDDIKPMICHKLKSEKFEFEFCVGEKSPQEIDKINILQASLVSMKEASIELKSEDSIILIDGNKTFETPNEIEAVVKGDSKSVVIALASIIAKEYRDKLMVEYSLVYPGYGLERHAGYPTVAHKAAVKELGVTPIHRKSFRGVKEFL